MYRPYYAIVAKPYAVRDPPWAHCLQKGIARVRALVAYPLREIKRQVGDSKVGYRWFAKNTAQVVTLFALSNVLDGPSPCVAPERIIASMGRKCANVVVISHRKIPLIA